MEALQYFFFFRAIGGRGGLATNESIDDDGADTVTDVITTSTTVTGVSVLIG